MQRIISNHGFYMVPTTGLREKPSICLDRSVLYGSYSVTNTIKIYSISKINCTLTSDQDLGRAFTRAVFENFPVHRKPKYGECIQSRLRFLFF